MIDFTKTTLFMSECNCVSTNDKPVLEKEFGCQPLDTTKTGFVNILKYKGFTRVLLESFKNLVLAYNKAGFESVELHKFYKKLGMCADTDLMYMNTTLPVLEESMKEDSGITRVSVNFLYRILKQLKKADITKIHTIDIYIGEEETYPLMLHLDKSVWIIAPRVKNE